MWESVGFGISGQAPGGEKEAVEPMLISGRWTVSLDERGRFQLPAAVRQRLEAAGESGFYICKADDKPLRIFWGRQLERALHQVAAEMDPDGLDAFLLPFGPLSVMQDLDAAGRLTIPDYLLSEAKLKMRGPAVVVGKLYYLELWNETYLEDALEKIRNSEDAKRMTARVNATLPKLSGRAGGRHLDPPAGPPVNDGEHDHEAKETDKEDANEASH